MICFEVTKDLEHTCTAGIDGYGNLVLNIVYQREVRRSGKLQLISDDQQLALAMSGNRKYESGIRESVRWLSSYLEIGSQISVKILENNKADPPEKSQREQPDDFEKIVKENEARHRKQLEEEIAKWESRQESNKNATHKTTRIFPPVCFDVHLNDKRLCLAGHTEASIVSFILHCVCRDPKQLLPNSDSAQDDISYSIGGLIDNGYFNIAHLDWVKDNAKVGDEFKIELIKCDNPDPPIDIRKDDPKESVKRAKEYLKTPPRFNPI